MHLIDAKSNLFMPSFKESVSKIYLISLEVTYGGLLSTIGVYFSTCIERLNTNKKNTRDMSECFTKIYLYTRSLKLHGHKLQHCWCEAEVFRSFSTLDY
jgi:hypothetical protein